MRRHVFWIVELFIWVLILFLVSGGLMLVKYNYKKQFNTYQIFLPDVDGLIDGSPVKIMGIQVGYVNQIDIVGEDVYVKFVITERDVKIPSGSVATVEFSGLGGSKSLELYPPKTDVNPSGKFIIAQSPKRIHDSIGLFNDMFEEVADLTYTVSRFMDQVGIIKGKADLNKNESTLPIFEILDNSSNWLDRAQKKTDEITAKINNKKDGMNGKREKHDTNK